MRQLSTRLRNEPEILAKKVVWVVVGVCVFAKEKKLPHMHAACVGSLQTHLAVIARLSVDCQETSHWPRAACHSLTASNLLVYLHAISYTSPPLIWCPGIEHIRWPWTRLVSWSWQTIESFTPTLAPAGPAMIPDSLAI